MSDQSTPLSSISLPDAKAILDIDLEGISLTPKEVRFVAAYCTNGFNEVNALKEAGYFTLKSKTNNSMIQQAGILIRKPSIVEAIKRFVDASIKPYRAKLEVEIMQIYYKRATYHISTFFTARGLPKSLNEIPLEWQCCIDGTTRRYYGKDADKAVQEYQLPNRDQALQMLYRMIKGVNVDENPDSNLLPGETRTKLKAFWENKDLQGIVSKVSAVLERKGKAGRPKKVL